MESKARYHYMDSMRSIFMLLGVVLHAASPYTLVGTWYVRNPEKSFAFDLIVNTIHTFRMPAFFIIAGFFVMMALDRSQPRAFLKMRLVRIGVPLLATAVFFNTFESYARDAFLAGGRLPLWSYLQHDIPRRLATGDWMSHLWFLVYLLVYFFVAVAVYAVATRSAGRPAVKRAAALLRDRGRFLFVLPLAYVVMAGLGRISPDVFHGDHILGLIQPIDFLNDLVFFLFGMWLFADRQLQTRFLSVRPWHVLLFVAAAVDWSIFARTVGATWQHMVEIYCEGVLAWLGCKFCFTFFQKFLDRPSKVFAYLADASYSIYLFHHLVVIVLASMLISHPMPIALKFLIVAAAAFAITLAMHHFLVLRFGILRFLFNGNPLNRKPKAALPDRLETAGPFAPARVELTTASAGRIDAPALVGASAPRA